MDFIIIANAWSAGVDNPTSKHQIALELAKAGHRVLWMEGAGMRQPSLGSGADRSRIVRKIRAAFAGVRQVWAGAGSGSQAGAIWVIAPLLIPVPKYGLIRLFNGWLYAHLARTWSRRLAFRDPVLINYAPVLADAMRLWRRRGVKAAGTWRAGHGTYGVEDGMPGHPASGIRHPGVSTVYHCVDRWDAFDMYDSGLMTRLDRQCCECADLVVASSRDLHERCLRLNPNTHLVHHGVNWEHFAQAVEPSRDRPAPCAPTIGFFGLLSEWVDQDLLLRLRREIPQARLVLIGKADVDIRRLEGQPGIELPGPKPFGELPLHIAEFTVGIIPFVVNDLTRAVNPIKLREMLAAGCPVVSTALPEVELLGRERQVVIARTADQFVDAVRDFVTRPLTDVERRAISGSMRAETWAAKTGRIVDLISAMRSPSP